MLDTIIAINQREKESQRQQVSQGVNNFLQGRQNAQNQELRQAQIQNIESQISTRKNRAGLEDLNTLLSMQRNAQQSGNPNVAMGIKKQIDVLTGARDGEISSVNDAIAFPVPKSTVQTLERGVLEGFLGEIDPRTGQETEASVRIKNKIASDKDRVKKELNLEFQNQEPLSREAAGSLAGAKQGLSNINDIKELLNLKRDPETNRVSGQGLKRKLAQQRLSEFDIPVPIVDVIPEAIAQSLAGRTGRSLDLNFQTLAENILRARTGATAPDPEIVRELKRSLLRLTDDPETLLERLDENEVFLKDIKKGIRPQVGKSVFSNIFEGIK